MNNDNVELKRTVATYHEDNISEIKVRADMVGDFNTDDQLTELNRKLDELIAKLVKPVAKLVIPDELPEADTKALIQALEEWRDKPHQIIEVASDVRKTVWLVREPYEDVEGVFSTRAEAEAFIRRTNNADYWILTEWPVGRATDDMWCDEFPEWSRIGSPSASAPEGDDQ